MPLPEDTEAEEEADAMMRLLVSELECTGEVMESFAASVKGKISSIEPDEFIEIMQSGVPCVDARSPKEYEDGHIPGARSLPLFSNDERAEASCLAH